MEIKTNQINLSINVCGNCLFLVVDGHTCCCQREPYRFFSILAESARKTYQSYFLSLIRLDPLMMGWK